MCAIKVLISNRLSNVNHDLLSSNIDKIKDLLLRHAVLIEQTISSV